LRVVAGGAATAIPISKWLMAFSVFFFLSLAFAKRYAELVRHGHAGGRGYRAADLPILGTMGVASAFTASVVFALYVNSEQALSLYARGDWLWLACPAILYWLLRVWLLAHRDQLHDDPIVFALKDRVSYLLGALVLGVVLLSI
jgi:hypothetical protein